MGKSKGSKGKAVQVGIVTEMGIDLSHVPMIAEALAAKIAAQPGRTFTAAVRDFDALATEVAIAAGITRISHIQATDWEAHRVHSARLDKEVNLGAIYAAKDLAERCDMVVIAQPKPTLGDRLYQNSALLAAATKGAEIVLVRPEVVREDQ
jgi:hypothetical protein